jgi:VIT1/CCC1 family predicted Fe2+/Mn2+ transporter/rubrerythrin
MTSQAARLSRTDRNLWNAIVSEALAYLKYNAYAHRALEEGHPEVAQLFQEVAGAETVHGLSHLRVAGEISTSLDNLRAVSAGEAEEINTMYPRMIREAINEGRTEAADSFALAMEGERHHLELFQQALGQLQDKLARQHGVSTAAGLAAQTVPSPLVSAPEGPDLAPVPQAPSDLETYAAASREIDRERERVAWMGRLREVVFGVQDGILSTMALVTGVAVAVGEQSIVLVAGFAGALPGMISMATGAFLASRAERDVQRAEIAREAKELEENPAEELAELVVLFQREGKSFADARHLADDIAQDKGMWLRTMVEKELGFSADDTTNPVKDALTMGLAFIVAALIPILPHFFLDGGVAIAISVSAALLGLFALGVGKGFLVHKSPLRQGIEILGVGAISAAVGFGLGDGIPRLFA